MQLNPLQLKAVEALHTFLQSPDEHYFLLTGKAGTGKTTVIINFLKELSTYAQFLKKTGTKHKLYNTYLTAPTNKATAVLANMKNSVDLPNVHTNFMTIHSVLNLKLQNNYNTGKKNLIQFAPSVVHSTEAIIFVDEYSMVDDALLEYIERDLGKAKVVFLGDKKQLPPISKTTPNKVENLVSTACHVHLVDVERQTEVICNTTNKVIPNPIHTTALLFREAIKTKSFAGFKASPNYVEIVNGAQFKQLVADTFINAEENLDNRILAWRNDTVEKYNDYISEEKYKTKDPQLGQKYIVSQGGTLFTTEEAVTVTAEFNADSIDVEKGIALVSVNHTSAWFIYNRTRYTAYKKILAKDAKKNKTWPFFFEFTDNIIDIRKPYAQTVHKSQGSTYKTVFIDYNDILTCRDKDTVLRMLYVAVSRPTDKLYIYMSNLK